MDYESTRITKMTLRTNIFNHINTFLFPVRNVQVQAYTSHPYVQKAMKGKEGKQTKTPDKTGKNVRYTKENRIPILSNPDAFGFDVVGRHSEVFERNGAITKKDIAIIEQLGLDEDRYFIIKTEWSQKQSSKSIALKYQGIMRGMGQRTVDTYISAINQAERG